MTLSSKLVLKDLPDYPIKETIKRALDENIKIPIAPFGLAQTKDKNTVRSVQRISNPSKKTALGCPVLPCLA